MAEIQFKFDFRRKNRNILARMFNIWYTKKTRIDSDVAGSSIVIRNQSLSISQLYFHPFTDLCHLVAKVTSSSSRLLFYQFSNPIGKRVLLSI